MSYTVLKNGLTYSEITTGMDQAEIDAEVIWFDISQALNDRYMTHIDINGAMNSSSYVGTNTALMYNDIIQNHNSSLMDELETFETALAEFKSEQDSTDESTRARIHGLKVVDFINHLNKQHLASSQDVRDLYDHADSGYAKFCLEGGALDTAAGIITSMDLTSIVTTEADRTKILAKISEY